MAGRKDKNTVEYFPHYCASGKTLYILENKYGNDGYAVWFKTLELLGASDNHFVDCRDAASWEFMLAKMRLTSDSLQQIYDTLATLGAINPDLWEKRVIWSENFIKNVADVYVRRKSKLLTYENLCQHLFNLCDQKLPSDGMNADINTQSKVKESKVKESISPEPEKSEDPEPPEEIQKPPVPGTKKKPTDYTFLDGIIAEFQKAHLAAYGIPYEIVNIGMERKAAQSLSKLNKAANPIYNTEEAMAAMKVAFKIIMDIDDTWLANHMSLMTIASKYNDIKKIISLKNNGNKRNKDGTTPATEQEIAAIIAAKFGSDSTTAA